MSPIAARKLAAIVENLERVLAIELLAAFQAMEFLRPLDLLAAAGARPAALPPQGRAPGPPTGSSHRTSRRAGVSLERGGDGGRSPVCVGPPEGRRPDRRAL